VTAGRRLPRRWFARPGPDLAPDVLGRVLVRRLPDGTRLAVRIVETEAYAQGDPASHSFRGPTPRTAVMFGPPGHAYVYYTYGMHHCVNVVAGETGTGTAVLVRAAEPVDGIDAMARHRGTDDLRLLCSGPARLCEALAVDRALDGTDLVRGTALSLHEGVPVPRRAVLASTRVGIRTGIDRPWRFRIAGDPFASPSRGAGDERVRPSRRR
jgi:DNA-3-methyladenine glycosylase